MKLSDNIKTLRIEHEWSQDELAHKIGYTSRSTVSKIEKGEIDIPHSKVVEIAKVFGVTPMELMGFDDKEDLKNEIMGLFDKLTSDQQEAVLNFLRSMITNRQ